MTDLLDADSAAGLAVHGGRAVPGALDALAELNADGVPGLLAEKDPTLWGDAAETEAKARLGWLDTAQRSRELVDRLAGLRRELLAAGLDHVVLAGMGGSSLAPEVIARTVGRKLTILDTTDPGQVGRALADRLDRTVVVVASKSGATVETDSHLRVYRRAFADAGFSGADLARRIVVVTDPGSPLSTVAGEYGHQVFEADWEVGGRYSALTAFGLVPTALAGVDVAELLDQAEDFAHSFTAEENPALVLGAALAAAALAGRDKLALVDDGTGITGLGDWVEQLIAESTGKDGRGLLPVVIETPDSPGASGPDVLTVTLGGSLPPGAVPGGGVRPQIAVNGPLGAQFLAWEYATAVAGRLLGVNPFDQPNVAESKENTGRILTAGLAAETPAFTEGAIEVYGSTGATTVADALGLLLARVDRTGYLAVMAYLDRVGDAGVAAVRAALGSRTDRPVTFGWGPRFLHSTGQFHKGGPQTGSFLQITGAVGDSRSASGGRADSFGAATADLPVPDRAYTLGDLQAAQAAGDRQALAGRGRPVLHLHLTDRAAGAAQLLDVVATLPRLS